MIIWVDDELFNGAKSDIDLFSLLRHAAQRRHTLVISSSPSKMWCGTAPNFLAWQDNNLTTKLQREVLFLVERLRLISNNSVTRSKTKPIYVAENNKHTTGGCILNLEQAIRAVALPLHILVENQINDAAFLRTVMPIAWKNKLESWERSGELRYVQAGGITEMRRLLEFHREDAYAKKAFGLPSEIWILSHFLIYDHDGKDEFTVGGSTKDLEVVIRKTSISHHRTWRRTQENYLPQTSLIKIIDFRNMSEADAAKLKNLLTYHFDQDESIRHFSELPQLSQTRKFFKNEFEKNNNIPLWNPADFQTDGSWKEMTILAEAIAAAI